MKAERLSCDEAAREAFAVVVRGGQQPLKEMKSPSGLGRVGLKGWKG